MTLTLIGSAHTADNDGAIEITSGIDNTYEEYQFHFYNIHPQNDGVDWQFQVDTGTNTNWNMYITSASENAWHLEESTGSSADVEYNAGDDQENSDQAYQNLTGTVGTDAEESLSGVLTIFSPADTSFLKQFISRCTGREEQYTRDHLRVGMIGTAASSAGSGETSAITRIRFRFETGNIVSGSIKMFGSK